MFGGFVTRGADFEECFEDLELVELILMNVSNGTADITSDLRISTGSFLLFSLELLLKRRLAGLLQGRRATLQRFVLLQKV